MSLVTPTDLQAQGIGLALSESELQTVIDQEEAELVRRYGPNYADAPITETVAGGGQSLYLRRAIASITSIAETWLLGEAPNALVAADYYLWGDEGRIERLPGHTRWGHAATVVYTPIDDTDLRRMVLTELCRIATEQTTPGGASVAGLTFRIGQQTDADGAGWAAQRSAQYARLGFLGR